MRETLEVGASVSLRFNRTPLVVGGVIAQPDQLLVKNTLALWNVSPEDAAKYGGDLTREALGAVRLRNDRKYVVVDTKVHMLMPGLCPALPGWHTDHTPRGTANDPNEKSPPNLAAQETLRPPRMHLLVTGLGCMTQFLDSRDVVLAVPQDTTTAFSTMAALVAAGVRDGSLVTRDAVSCQSVEWDWWELHQGTLATMHEWRFLIRVTETDYQQPKTDPREFIRTQQQVYAPEKFGW